MGPLFQQNNAISSYVRLQDSNHCNPLFYDYFVSVDNTDTTAKKVLPFMKLYYCLRL